MSHCRLLVGDVRDTLPTLASGSVRCVVTSPPYWGLRDYGMPGQLGLERTPEEYVANLVGVMRKVRRVLADDGTLWLNLGDSYCAAPNGGHGDDTSTLTRPRDGSTRAAHHANPAGLGAGRSFGTLKPKDLVGIHWRVAFALQADGWYLRSDIIWAKPNPMPESVTDRPTKAHEFVFLLSKAARYFYDAAAIAEPATCADPRLVDGFVPKSDNGKHAGAPQSAAVRKSDKQRGHGRRDAGFNDRWDAMEKAEQCSGTRNARSVWTIATSHYAGAHFATFPEELARRCILTGSAPGDTVLDPFGGSGTVGAVAIGNGRGAVLCELNHKYADLAVQRVGPMYVTVAP